MNESTVNIADFRGIREIKPHSADGENESISYGFLVIDSTRAYEGREQLNEPREFRTSSVFDIGMVREAQRFGLRYGPSVVRRGAKVLSFADATKSRSCRGVATWNASFEDPNDCPPAA